MRLAWKLTLPQLCIVVCIGLISFVVVNASFDSMRDRYMKDVVAVRFKDLLKDIEASAQASVTQTSYIATLPVVAQAYDLAFSGDINDPYSPQVQAARELLRTELAAILRYHEQMTGQKPMVHFHLPNGLSLVRLWSDKQAQINGEWVDFSDNLLPSRAMVMDVRKSGWPVMGLEVGRSGFAVRGMIPLTASDGKGIGSVEILQNFNDLVHTQTLATDIAVVLYANKELAALAPDLQDRARYPRKGDFLRISTIQDADFEAKISPDFLLSGKHGTVYAEYGTILLAARPFADYSGKQVGVLVCALDTEGIAHYAQTGGLSLALLLTGMAAMSGITLFLGSRLLVTRPLNMLREKMQHITEDRADLREKLPVRHQDEIGGLIGWFNVLTAKLVSILDELREADGRMQSVLEVVPLAAMLVDKDDTFLYCNQEAANLVALPDRQDYLSRFFEFSPPFQPCGRTSREVAAEKIALAFEQGGCHFEWMKQDISGAPIPCQVTLARVKQGKRDLVACFALDLRERQEMLDELRKEAAQLEEVGFWYESILDALPFPIAVQNAQARWTFVNIALEQLIRKKREQILGMPCCTWNTSICKTDQCSLACAKRGQTQTYFVHEGLSYQINVALLKNVQGKTTGFVEMIQDVTKLERMAQERTDAEATSQAKSAFLARMSHEIRTPMNAILGITEIQMHNALLSPELKDAFGRIYVAGYTLLGIINDLLDLSKIEAGRMDLLPVKYEIASMISDVVQVNLSRIGNKPIEFRLEVDAEIPSELFGDELRIRQILNNLLSNAFKYTQKGHVELSIFTEGGSKNKGCDVTLVCCVKDTGQGMTEEQVRRLFDEYTRFYLEANRTIEGIGLGMNITRQLVHMMNGEIFVSSTPDLGSTFTVRLPQGQVGEGKLGPELAANLQHFKGGMRCLKTSQIVREPMPYGSVLVVDDLETNVYVSRGLMTPYGLSVDSALSGLEAIRKIGGGKKYDIVFMDHMMPKMDGVEAVKILRAMGYTKPIVALTANAVAGQAEMFLAKGFNDFLSKPIDLRQLNAMLNRFVRDVQPPEVIEAARAQQSVGDAGAPQLTIDPQLASIFIRDAEKTLVTLEAMYANQYRRDNDGRMFIITTHAIKSALANIGETELANFAYRLEQAGRAEDIAVMLADTPVFLSALQTAMAKLRPPEGDGDDAKAVDEDPALLNSALSTIEAACAAYDHKGAKDALVALKGKKWSRRTSKQLDAIAGHLLHSEFEEAAGLAEEARKTLQLQ